MIRDTCTFILVCVVTIGTLAIAPIKANDQSSTTQPVSDDRPHSTTPLSLHQRIVNSILGVRGDTFPATNLRKAEDDRIRMLRSTTAEQLKHPTVLSSCYWPKSRKNGTVAIELIWMENQPSLHEVIVWNPETGKEERIAFPEWARKDASENVKLGVTFGWMARVSVEVTGDNPAQVLELRAPGQIWPANCYPSIKLPGPRLRSAPLTTMPTRVPWGTHE